MRSGPSLINTIFLSEWYKQQEQKVHPAVRVQRMHAHVTVSVAVLLSHSCFPDPSPLLHAVIAPKESCCKSPALS